MRLACGGLSASDRPPGTLTFRPGERTKNIWIPVHKDDINEQTETLTLRLSNPTSGTITDGTAQGRIHDK